MSVIWQEAVIHTKVFMRERHAAFWAHVFPIMLLVLFCSVFGYTPEDSTALLAGVVCINIMSGAFYGIGVNIVALREQKILRRYKVTPVPLSKVILGLCLSQVAIISLTTSLLMAVAKLFYKVTLPANAAAFLVVFLMSTFMFCTIAFAVTSVSRNGHQANALTQLLFMPMMFLSGATLPYEAMPAWIQKVAMALPATYQIMSLRAVFAGGGLRGDLKNLVIMAAFSLIAAAISVRFFRWE